MRIDKKGPRINENKKYYNLPARRVGGRAICLTIEYTKESRVLNSNNNWFLYQL